MLVMMVGLVESTVRIMSKKRIKILLESVYRREISVDDALDGLKRFPYENLNYAMVDHHRSLRCSHSETIFAEGKTLKQILGIAKDLMKENTNVIVTRAGPKVYEAFKLIYTSTIYHEKANIVVLNPKELVPTSTNVLVIGAGTADIGVCEEAAVTAEIMGNRVERLYDVGVAGIHRVLSNIDKIESSSVIIVVAGMDGALPAVVAGITDKLVIAVPTSIGYGTNFAGVTPLLTMLNSCSSGVTVVNIDNGYGAGYSASVVNRIANLAKS